jgi:N6-adenosine-specific RNA methylase IME4
MIQPALLTPGAQAAPVQRDWISGASGYGTICADPPWAFKTRSEKGMDRSPEQHYQTMTLADIAAMPVASLAAPDCALFMWCIDSLLPEAIEVGRAWGFTYKTVGFVWAKCSLDGAGWPIGTGYWTRANPELCLLFTRGAPKRLSASVRKLIVAPRREHSRKPDEARAAIERLVAGPYLELFAREAAPGWDAYGNEVGKFTKEAAA